MMYVYWYAVIAFALLMVYAFVCGAKEMGFLDGDGALTMTILVLWPVTVPMCIASELGESLAVFARRRKSQREQEPA